MGAFSKALAGLSHHEKSLSGRPTSSCSFDVSALLKGSLRTSLCVCVLMTHVSYHTGHWSVAKLANGQWSMIMKSPEDQMMKSCLELTRRLDSVD